MKRSSNIELFRIVAMLAIVAYHAAWYSGLTRVAYAEPWSWQSVWILLLGGWGKTGINCFVLITGYFMCERQMTLGRLAKLIGLTEFYAFSVLGVRFALGEEVGAHSILNAALLFTRGINASFIPSFLALLCLVPVINWCIRRMSCAVHGGIVVGLLAFYCGISSCGIKINAGEIPWYAVLYLTAAFVRRYPIRVFDSSVFWGRMTLATLAVSALSMAVMAVVSQRIGKDAIYYWIFPHWKPLAVAVSLSAFMYFKNLSIGANRWINAFGGVTFGVYLLHDGVMEGCRDGLWKFIIDAENCGGGADFDKIYCRGRYGICVLRSHRHGAQGHLLADCKECE